MKIIILGGDGFIGWPLSLRLSKNHDVVIVDNLMRREIDKELKVNSLVPIYDIETRINKWKELTGKNIKYVNFDVVKDYDKLINLIVNEVPDTIIHLATIKSAPYSMKDTDHKRHTIDHNISATHNVLAAVAESGLDSHIVHIGTMGVYGYGVIPDFDIDEGYFNVKFKNKHGEYVPAQILHPTFPGSIYHLTKSMDELMFQFYAKNNKLRITDLHQGIVWGSDTKDTKMDDILANRFDYDSDYGTVFNRFIMQAAHDIPLTIYGTGEQTRAFIHIENSIDCLEQAINNPPTDGKVGIFNQTFETKRLLDLAALLKSVNDKVEVDFVDNPRKELPKNELSVVNEKFLKLGIEPILIDEAYVKEVHDMINKHKDGINMEMIMPQSFW